MNKKIAVCLGLALLSTPAFAGNFMTVSQIESKSVQAYELELDCKKSGEQCIDVGEDPKMVALGYTSLENDWGLETLVESCADEADCLSKLQSKDCANNSKFISADYTKVYCVELKGKVLVKNHAGYNSFKAAQAQVAGMDSALNQVKKLRECGAGVIDLLVLRNATKQLTTTQVKAMVGTYASIMQLLQSASLVSAKEEIALVEPDGILVTESDKIALTSAINKCLGI